MLLRNKRLYSGLIMLIFLAIAIICVYFVLSPAAVHIKQFDFTTNKYEETVSAPAATTYGGLALRAEAWKEYPKYNIGIGIIGVLAFAGATATCGLMYLQKEQTDGALQSISRGM